MTFIIIIKNLIFIIEIIKEHIMKLYTYIFLLLMNAQCTRIGMADSCLASCKRTSNSCFTASILTSNMIYSNQSGASQTAIIKETEPNGNFSDAYKSSNFLGSNSISVKIIMSGAMSSDSDIDIIEASIGGSAFKDYRFSMTGNAGCELFYSSQSFLYSKHSFCLGQQLEQCRFNECTDHFPI